MAYPTTRRDSYKRPENGRFRDGGQNQRRPARGGGGGGGMQNRMQRSRSPQPAKVLVERHPYFKNSEIYISRGKRDAILTKNLTPGLQVYGEKRVHVPDDDGNTVEYRVWDPFRSKIAAGIVCNLENMDIKPGSKVLYLGAASGTTVSHVSDIVGENGCVYAVEFSNHSGRDLLSLCQKRPNIVPIIADARHPERYRMLVPLVDVLFADVSQPDQTRIVVLNADYFLREKGQVIMSIKANCIDSSLPAETIFEQETQKFRANRISPRERVLLDAYEKDHAILVGTYKKK